MAWRGSCYLLLNWLSWTLFTMVSAKSSGWISNLAQRTHPNENREEGWLTSCHIYHHPESHWTLPWSSVSWGATFKVTDHSLHLLLHRSPPTTFPQLSPEQHPTPPSFQGLLQSQTSGKEVPQRHFTIFTWDFISMKEIFTYFVFREKKNAKYGPFTFNNLFRNTLLLLVNALLDLRTQCGYNQWWTPYMSLFLWRLYARSREINHSVS